MGGARLSTRRALPASSGRRRQRDGDEPAARKAAVQSRSFSERSRRLSHARQGRIHAPAYGILLLSELKPRRAEVRARVAPPRAPLRQHRPYAGRPGQSGVFRHPHGRMADGAGPRPRAIFTCRRAAGSDLNGRFARTPIAIDPVDAGRAPLSPPSPATTAAYCARRSSAPCRTRSTPRYLARHVPVDVARGVFVAGLRRDAARTCR